MKVDRAQAQAIARRRLDLLPQELDAVGGLRMQPETSAPPSPILPKSGRHLRERSRFGALALPQLHLTRAHGMWVLVLGLVAALTTTWLVVRTAPSGEAVPAVKLSQPAPGPMPASGAPEVASDDAQVVVDVAGKVRRPGLVVLPAGSRVNDAIAKAGGVRAGVNLSSINLARVLVDGEQILVSTRGAQAGPSSASGSGGGGLVNLNSAGLRELDTLPGVGPVTAQKIVDWRTAHGAFTSVEDLLEVPGIGDKTLADIAPHVTL